MSMKYLILASAVFIGGCSTYSLDNEVRERFHHPMQQKFVIAWVMQGQACTKFDAISVQVCSYMKRQLALLPPGFESFGPPLFSNPPGQLGKDEQNVFDNYVLMGAHYRDYTETKEAADSAQSNQRAFQWGALTGALLAPPARQTPTTCYNYGSFSQCY